MGGYNLECWSVGVLGSSYELRVMSYELIHYSSTPVLQKSVLWNSIQSITPRISFFIKLIIASYLIIGFTAFAQSDSNSIRITVLSYNVHHGEGEDGRLDLERIAGIINDVSPDYVALQEVDSVTTRTGGVDQAARYAELTGMYWEFARGIAFG